MHAAVATRRQSTTPLRACSCERKLQLSYPATQAAVRGCQILQACSVQTTCCEVRSCCCCCRGQSLRLTKGVSHAIGASSS